MAEIEVEFVTVERRFWSGTASMVVAKTSEGEIGIQAGHEPLLGELDAAGTVTVYTDEGRKVAAVQGGFLLFRPSKTDFEHLKALTREGDFRDSTGWKGSGVGWCR